MKQSRRSFSVRGLTYQRIESYTSGQPGMTISGFLEDLIEEKLGPVTPEDCKKFDEAHQKRIEEKNRPRPTSPDEEMEGYVSPILML